MNYEKLLKIHDPEINFQILEKFDEYLVSLDDAESGFLYPELLSNILDVPLQIVERLLVYCSQLHICKTRFELTCPVEEVSFYYTFDREDLALNSISCTRCDLHKHDPAECETLISFKLLEIKNVKKKASLAVPSTTLTNTFDLRNLENLEKLCHVNIYQTNNYYEGQVNQINQGEGSVANTGNNQGTIANTSKSTVQTGIPLSEVKKEDEGFFNKVIKFFNDNKLALTSISLACLLGLLMTLYYMGIISLEEIRNWVKSALKSD